MDLMSLYRNKSYHLAKEIKKALVAYATGAHYNPKEIDFNNKIEGYVPTSVMFHINLSETNPLDQEVIDLLTHIKNGYRCSFIKAVFRSSCLYLPLLAYSDDSGFIMKKTSVFMENESNQTEPEKMGVKLESVKEEQIKPVPVKKRSTQSKDISKEVNKEFAKPKFVPVPKPQEPEEFEDNIIENSEEDLDKLFAKMDMLGR